MISPFKWMGCCVRANVGCMASTGLNLESIIKTKQNTSLKKKKTITKVIKKTQKGGWSRLHSGYNAKDSALVLSVASQRANTAGLWWTWYTVPLTPANKSSSDNPLLLFSDLQQADSLGHIFSCHPIVSRIFLNCQAAYMYFIMNNDLPVPSTHRMPCVNPNCTYISKEIYKVGQWSYQISK